MCIDKEEMILFFEILLQIEQSGPDFEKEKANIYYKIVKFNYERSQD